MVYCYFILIVLEYLNKPLIATSPIKASRTDSALIGPRILGLLSARDFVLRVTLYDATTSDPTTAAYENTMVYLFFDVFPVPIMSKRNRNVSKQQDVKNTA